MNCRTDWPLPPDVGFIIIDYLFDDQPTLASCSLVCSRWLPPSRRYLFHTVKVTPHKVLCPDRISDFLHTLQESGKPDPEWAIGTYVKKITLDGRFCPWNLDLGMSTLTCPVSLLSAVLSRLPQLASLRLRKLLILDDLSQDPDTEQCEHPRFELDELIASECSGPAHESHHLLALICTFSSIGSLRVIRWGTLRPHLLPTFSPAAFPPPTVRSLAVKDMGDIFAVRAVYTLLANSPPASNGHLTRVSLDATGHDQLPVFSDFVGIAGPMLREVELRIRPDVLGHRDLLRAIPLATCTALRSLVLCIQRDLHDSMFMAPSLADDPRWTLNAYTQILRERRTTFPGLASVRLEIQPVSHWLLKGFMLAAIDYDGEPDAGMEQTPGPAEEAQKNRRVWESLEDVLCEFSTLKLVEFVLYKRPEERITEEGKVDLRSALEMRLPMLWGSGAVQLVFETSESRYRAR